MIATIIEFFRACWHRSERDWRDREIMWASRKRNEEGRRLLEALGEPVAGKSQLEIMAVLAEVGLVYLRDYKASLDTIRADQEMARRIQAGPRPNREEAQLN